MTEDVWVLGAEGRHEFGFVFVVAGSPDEATMLATEETNVSGDWDVIGTLDDFEAEVREAEVLNGVYKR